MIVRLLGTAAGGGVPQWNCGCPGCSAARASPDTSARTQEGAAVGREGGSWALLNASPDLRAQLTAHDDLAPRPGTRESPVVDVVLTDAELDHVTGLLLLREAASAPRVLATRTVLTALSTALPLRQVLGAYARVDWCELDPGVPVSVADGAARVTALPVGSKRPRYARDVDLADGWVSALRLDDEHGLPRVLYAPCLAEWTAELTTAAAACETVVVDGTFWRDDELAGSVPSSRTAREMGHLAVAGPGGTLEHLHALTGRRRILTHVNNSNPVLAPGGAECALLDDAGVDVAVDGLVAWRGPEADQPDGWRPRLARGVRLGFDDLRRVDVLLAPENVVRLSTTAAAVLQRCDGQRRVDDIVTSLGSSFTIVEDPYDDVAPLLRRFRDRGWVA